MGCTLRNSNKKSPHVGEIGEGESDVRLLPAWSVYRNTVHSATGKTWSGSPLWKEATASMTALVYSRLHTRLYRGYVHVYWPRVRKYTRRLTKRISTTLGFQTLIIRKRSFARFPLLTESAWATSSPPEPGSRPWRKPRCVVEVVRITADTFSCINDIADIRSDSLQVH
jgi:hypothetical protein